MPRKAPKERKYDLYQAILEIKDFDECVHFFEDLCAMTELSAIEQRFDVAKMLLDDKVYIEIMKENNASSATISRVNRVLNSGTGALAEVISRANAKLKETEDKAEAE